ncbi:MAG: hypothetical protein HY898_19200 [Deltaproteobacteria bacterium]|nr:hypothetical protein [Deltaproteobacteria bacterium]
MSFIRPLVCAAIAVALVNCASAVPAPATTPAKATPPPPAPAVSIALAVTPASPQPVDSRDWIGVWERVSSRFSPARLDVKADQPGKVRIKLDASTGANIGSIEGIATLGADSASFDRDGCSLTLVRSYEGVEVRSKGCDSQLGAGVTLDGAYLQEGQKRTYKPGFDCLRMSSPIESIICHDELLSLADAAMTASYKQGLAGAQGMLSAPNMKASDAYSRKQQQWLSERNKCEAAPNPRACLIVSYRKRILELRKVPAPGRVDAAALRAASSRKDADSFWGDATMQLYLAERLGPRYEALLDRMMIVNPVDDAKSAAVEGCVRGICPGMRAYVAVDARGAMWAALFPGDKDNAEAVVLIPGAGAEPDSLKAWIRNLGTPAVKRVKAFE